MDKPLFIVKAAGRGIVAACSRNRKVKTLGRLRPVLVRLQSSQYLERAQLKEDGTTEAVLPAGVRAMDKVVLFRSVGPLWVETIRTLLRASGEDPYSIVYTRMIGRL